MGTALEDAPRWAAFWSAATGAPLNAPGGRAALHQPARCRARSGCGRPGRRRPAEPQHFDVETDDVPTETTVLLDLGAAEISAWAGCHTLRAPALARVGRCAPSTSHVLWSRSLRRSVVARARRRSGDPIAGRPPGARGPRPADAGPVQAGFAEDVLEVDVLEVADTHTVGDDTGESDQAAAVAGGGAWEDPRIAAGGVAGSRR